MPCKNLYWDRDDIIYGVQCQGREPFLVILSGRKGIVGEQLKEYAYNHSLDKTIPSLVDAVYDYGSHVIFIEVKRFAHPKAVIGVIKRILAGDKVGNKSLPWGSGWKNLVYKLRQPSFVLPRGYYEVEPLMDLVRMLPDDLWREVQYQIERLPVRKISHLQYRLVEKYVSTYSTLNNIIGIRKVLYFVVLFAKPLWLSHNDMKIFSYLLRNNIWHLLVNKAKSLSGVYVLFQSNELLDVDIMYHHYIRGYNDDTLQFF